MRYGTSSIAGGLRWRMALRLCALKKPMRLTSFVGAPCKGVRALRIREFSGARIVN